MKVPSIERNIPWLPLPNEVSLVLDNRTPPVELITSALALAFDGQRLLMTKLRQRGWDLPGGHIEPGENPEQAMRREVLEEAGALLGPVSLLGYQQIRILGQIPCGYRYPCPDSYQVFYIGQIIDLHPVQSSIETYGRGLFAPHEAKQLQWVQQHRSLYEAALDRVMQER